MLDQSVEHTSLHQNSIILKVVILLGQESNISKNKYDILDHNYNRLAIIASMPWPSIYLLLLKDSPYPSNLQLIKQNKDFR